MEVGEGDVYADGSLPVGAPFPADKFPTAELVGLVATKPAEVRRLPSNPSAGEVGGGAAHTTPCFPSEGRLPSTFAARFRAHSLHAAIMCGCVCDTVCTIMCASRCVSLCTVPGVRACLCACDCSSE
jgi:hypothetical protein